MDASKILGMRVMTKSMYVTHVEGTRLLQGKDPVGCDFELLGKWKPKTAERWLRDNYMDPSITIIKADPVWRKYAIDSADFLRNAKEITTDAVND